jgi:hypothetical protein
MALAALCPFGIARADGRQFTISTGHNETALTSEFNRSTALRSQISRGRMLYLGAIDSRGLASIGLGRIASGEDVYYHTARYPVLTVFARHGEGPGVALDLHQDWYDLGNPTRSPGKFLTLFQTTAGVVCQDGELPKVRVTQRFVSSERMLPGRSQGLEWVLEFRDDYPAEFARAGTRGAMAALVRRSMRQEQWAFFSRELSFGVLRVSIGQTYKTVSRPVPQADPSAPLTQQLQARMTAGQTRVPVLMVRLAYDIRRW